MIVSGIYLLKFKGYHGVYVGQSLDIYTRYSKHLYRLKNNLANHKLQEAYEKYGEPNLEILHILDESSGETLDELEQMAIEIFDSVNTGLNIRTKPAGGGEGLQGQYHGNSKYTNDLIIQVFSMICQPTNSFKDIASILGVNINLVRDISKGKAHRWLKDLYPDKYVEMLELINTREKNTYKDKYGFIPKLKSPSGDIVSVHNITEFSKQNSLNKSHISGVLSGKRKSHLGWTLP